MDKRIALLITVALLMVVTACTPGPGGNGDPSGWPAYTNAKFGYQVQYSPDWAYREFPDTGTGAGFRLESAAAEPQNEFIVVDAMGAPVEYDGQKTAEMPFADYVKIAAMAEIQGIQELASIEEVEANGLTGYVTTWEYQDMGSTELKTSLPIAYFELNKTVDGQVYRTLQINLSDAAQRAGFDTMVRSVKLTGQ